MTVVGDRASTTGGGYVYRVVLRLRETSGVAATVMAVDLTFMNDANAVMTSRHDDPVPSTANVCPASGTVETRELVTTDAGTSHPYATTVHAKVTYTDVNGVEWTASGSADIPPLLEPPPPATFGLTGVVTEQATNRGIDGARVEVLNGVNAGVAATADNTGLYVFKALAAGTFRLRASAPGYDTGEQNVTVPDVPHADFQLRKGGGTAPCAYSISPGTIRIPFTAGQFPLTIAHTSGACDWRADVDVSWITISTASGSGTSQLTVSYRPNAAFVGRLGTISIEWSGGRAQLTVAQDPETPAFCRIVAVTVNGQNPFDAPAAGAQFTAQITPEPGTPTGVCGPWTASASAGITFVGASSGQGTPSSLIFVVQANPLATARSMSITVTFLPSGPSASLTIRQSGTS